MGGKNCGNHYVSFLRGDRILSMDCPGSIIRYTLRTGCPTLNQLMSWDFNFDAHIKILIMSVVYIMLSLKKGLKTAICQSQILMISLYFYDEILLRNVNIDHSLPHSVLAQI